MATRHFPILSDTPGAGGESDRFSFPTKFRRHVDAHGDLPYHLRRAIKVKAEGADIIHNPLFNKGAAWRYGERDRLGIRGLLPPRGMPMEDQIRRVHIQLAQEDTPIRKNRYLRDLQDTNETLFHRVLLDNIRELAPIVYTPTVGLACQRYSHAFRRARGMYFNIYDKCDMTAMMYNWPASDVHVIVITDGGRILGLGDLGANGMGIPIGKLNLYCAAGGIAPHRVLPIMFDVGTNNEELLKDPFYIGQQHRRLEGDDYFELLDELMGAIFARYPNTFVQFEDFSSHMAQKVLSRYRDKYLCFNDDIQGTGATAIAGVMSALRSIGEGPECLRNKRILIAGAGSAGLGVANALVNAMVCQGLSLQEARDHFWVCDVHGVLAADRKDLSPEQLAFGRKDETAGMDLLSCAKKVKPNVLLGLSAVPGLFTEALVKEMAAINERPVIFPLSNPTSKCEASAEQVYQWTDGRAIFASGSPFDPVTLNGKVYSPGQCNNMFIFPGIGLGAVVCGARTISENTVYKASLALVECLTADERAKGAIFPDIERIREVSLEVAKAVVRQVNEEGLCNPAFVRDANLHHEDELHRFVRSRMWDPVYVPLVDEVYRGM